jgi:hypothetical protein
MNNLMLDRIVVSVKQVCVFYRGILREMDDVLVTYGTHSVILELVARYSYVRTYVPYSNTPAFQFGESFFGFKIESCFFVYTSHLRCQLLSNLPIIPVP